jgi:poly-gamma-glutamate capsule biosynthesis protein CapA/YwtB (metallophosphatase superfamily)
MSIENGCPLWALILIPVLLSATTPAAGQGRAKEDVRLLFTGDILLSRQVEVELETRIRPPWAGFQKLFRGGAWVGGNFEGAIGRPSNCLGSNSPCFATPESAAELLRRAGFHIVTVENNHAGDLGTLGREHTRQIFRKSGLLAVDFNNSPQFVQLGKTSTAVVALTLVPAADGRVQHIPSTEISEKLRLAKQRANLVVVSIHWGNELMEWPSDSQRKEAAWLVEEGADLILGHHPHVIQRPECVSGRPVFFSLGNHVFDQANPKTKEGMIADCRIRRGRLRCQDIRTHTDPGTAIPALTGPDRMSNATLATCTPKVRASHN